MNIFFVSILSILTTVSYQSGFYEIVFKDIKGNTVQVSSFQQRKLVFTTFSAGKPEVQQLKYLDSLQTANPTVKFFVIPAEDYAGAANLDQLRNFQNIHCPNIQMTEPMNVKKTSGLNQHSLFKWLTDVNRNSHFDIDAEAGGQLFFVAPGAKLFSVLAPGAPSEIVVESILQNVN
jgi:glutathione peroxidase-family protein